MLKTQPMFSTPIYRSYVESNDTVIESSIQELLTHVNLSYGKENLFEKRIQDTPDLAVTNTLIGYVKEHFKEYLFEVTGSYLEFFDYSSVSWAMLIDSGKGLEPHLHANSQFSSILYLTDASAELVLEDPRGNAQRAYPLKLREVMFPQYRITPKKGELVIFPSFVSHYVRSIEPEFRISLVTDFFLNEADES